MKDQIINLEEFNISSLTELQGWEAKQKVLLKENPFIEIKDNNTYSEGKKRRTALLKGRTEIQKQDKLIASKIKTFRAKVFEESNKLISITIEAEDKQQEEVKVYEDRKESEREEKARLEQERRELVLSEINTFFDTWKSKINEFTIQSIKEVNIIEELSNVDTEKFNELSTEFNEKTRVLTQLFSDKKHYLLVKEEQDIESKRLEDERKNLEAKQAIEAEKIAKERRDFKAEQERYELVKKKEEGDRLLKQAVIDSETKKIQDGLQIEKDRQLKAQSEIEKKEIEDRIKSEEKEANKQRVTKEKAAKKRVLDLQPDKEKLNTLIESIVFSIDTPELKDAKSKKFFKDVILQLDQLKLYMINSLKQLN